MPAGGTNGHARHRHPWNSPGWEWAFPRIPGPRGGKAKFQHHSPGVPRGAQVGGPSPPNSPSHWVLPCPAQGSETSPGALPAAPGTPPAGIPPQRAPCSGDSSSSSSAPPPQRLAKAQPGSRTASPLPAHPLGLAGSWGCFDSSKQ